MILPDGDPVSGPDARRVARAELRHAVYGRAKPSLPSRVSNWIGDHLARLFGHAAGPGDHALLLLLVVLLAVVVVVAVRAGVPRLTRSAVGGDADDDLLAADAVADHRRRALELTAQGRRAEALREWLRAAVRSIEDRGVLPPRPGRTGAVTAREAGSLLPAAAPSLAAATAAFDEVWFGGRAASDADVEAGRAAADAVRSAKVDRSAVDTMPAAPR